MDSDSQEHCQMFERFYKLFFPFLIKVGQCDDPPEKKPTKMAIGKINFLIRIVTITCYHQYAEKIEAFQ